MAVVIRLQGLPMVAGTMDIRHFFSGLTIPDGGVHIVGGDLGEAFVMFATDEDARIGMMRSGGTIKTSKISLLLSSKTEMQNVIEQSRRRYEVGSSGGNTVSVVSMEGPPLVASVCPAGNNMQGTPPISGTTIPPPLGGPSPTLASVDVRMFFDGLALDSIVFTRDHMSRLRGEAFVRFLTARDAIEGMRRHRKTMGNRFVEVYPATEKEWLIAALANLAGMPEIVGGSGATTAGNALPFLPNISDLYVVFGPDGTCAGEAFVEFMTGADFRIALSHHKQYLGSNLISVHPISKHCMMEKVEEFKRRQSVKSNNGRESESKSQKLQGGKGQLVHVGNIPSGVQKKDLQNFFRGFGVIESDIELIYNKKGECIGQAIVTFTSREVASRALRLNRVKLGGREVILHLVTHEQLCELQENLHSDSDTRRISRVFSHRADVAGAQPPALLPSLLPRPSSQPHSDGFLPLSDGVGGFSKSAPHAPTPGAVVRIQNLPSKVDRDEILDFFYGYRVIPDSVHVPLSHPHLPTNEAFVSFENPEEAASAVRELNDRPIGSLKVKLIRSRVAY
uniref:RNA binding motif protein 12 n=1 Tax=Eptatretus burgeri TaxID=7764 RepID=A0A8C4RAC0_EPTBU